MPELDALLLALKSKQDWLTVLPLAIAVLINLYKRWRSYALNKEMEELKIDNARLRERLRRYEDEEEEPR